MRERLKYWRRLRTYRRTLAAAHAGRRRPVLVYTMGKVASTTVQHALERVPELAPFHVHHIAAEPIGTGGDHRRTLSALLWRELVAPAMPCAVITLTREPIARNVSAFFQNLGHELGGAAPWRCPTPELVAAFLSRCEHEYPVRWFDTELRHVLGVDVYGVPFDPAIGHVRIDHARYPTLVLRCELPDADKGRLVGEFLGLGAITLPRANAAEDKAYAQAYRAFTTALCVPRTLAGALLQSRYARHFYSAVERAAACARWSERDT